MILRSEEYQYFILYRYVFMRFNATMIVMFLGVQCDIPTGPITDKDVKKYNKTRHYGKGLI